MPNYNVKDWFDQYLSLRAKTLAPRTVDSYQQLINLYLPPDLAAAPLPAVSRDRVQALYDELYDRETLATRTIEVFHTVLNQGLNAALKEGLIAENPCQGTKRKPKDTHSAPQLTAAERAKFLAALDDGETPPALAVMLALALEAKLRPEEFFAVQWRDVDFAASTLTVRRVVRRGHAAGWEYRPATPRVKELPAAMLDRLRTEQVRQAVLIRPLNYPRRNLLIGATETGTPHVPRSFSHRVFKPLLQRAGLSSKITLFSLSR